MKDLLTAKLSEIRKQRPSTSVEWGAKEAKEQLLIELIQDIDFELQLATDKLDRESHNQGIV